MSDRNISIQVIDAPCGAGKTSWAIQNINENSDESFIYCTPFLDEIDRIRKACGRYQRFSEPIPFTGAKIDNFNELLATGGDIAVTHITFLNATQETLDLIRTGNYTLIIDEVLDVVTDFNKVQSVENTSRQTITKEDIKFLLEREIISIAPDNRVIWCGGEYGDDFKFSEVQRYARLNRLYCVDNKLLLAVFPPEMFKYFKSVYIMTYLFGGSIFKYYLDLFDIKYETVSVSYGSGKYSLVEHSPRADIAFRQQCRGLIHVCDNAAMNDYKSNALSKTWYDNSKNDDRLKRLKCNIQNFYRRYLKGAKASNGDIMWTCFGEYENKLKGQGYTRERCLTEKDRALPEAVKENIEKELSCFVPCNAKATNIYRNRWALAYCVNMYFNPMIRRFFTDGNDERARNGMSEIYPDENMYALSCLVQWIFRSRIRDGKPISIYIPNKRMRQLFLDWMDCKDVQGGVVQGAPQSLAPQRVL